MTNRHKYASDIHCRLLTGDGVGHFDTAHFVFTENASYLLVPDK